MKGFIVYSDYLNEENKTIVRLFGRTEDSKSFVTLNKLVPYFFIKESDLKKAEKLLEKYKVTKTELKTFKGESVVKIESTTQTELNKLVHVLHRAKFDTFEADIKPDYRFMMDNNLLSTLEIKGESEPSERIDRVFNNPNLLPAHNYKPSLKVLSLDIESDRTGNLICIGLSGENYKKCFFVTNHKLEHSISCKSEEEALNKFKEELIKQDPDIITGWNVIDFDLKYLAELFAKHKIPFDLGRTNDKVHLRIESGFFRSSSADIPGRQVIDGLNLIGDPFLQQAPSMRNAQFDSYTLEDVAQVILGKGKLMKGKSRCIEIEKLYKENSQKSHQALADYNINDAELAYEILKKTATIELAIDRSLLTGMPLDRITASIASFDSLYIREARKRNLVSPTTKFTENKERIKGGYVFSEKPGVFNNVLVFDFKSLYPSIIRTFNIDPASFLEKKEKCSIEAPNKACFKPEEGILPVIIERLHIAREQAKKEKKELASYAIKTIMNSFFGVLASPNSRYFNLEMGNAITHFGQYIIKLTASEIEKRGYNVIYQDTDSIFIETNLPKEKANTLGRELQDYINSFYKEYIKEHYKRQSYLELQFDKQFISFMIPALRAKKGEEETEAKAAKKRYAGLVEKNGKEELEVTGLESIRGDWTEAARDFQKELLMKLFKKEPIIPFIKSYVKKIKEGKMDDKLIYRKSIRKELAEYTKTTPPHVKAARQLEHLDSNIIEYCITTEGPEPIQKCTHKLDYEHYIDKQIKPIANQVLALTGESFEDAEKSTKQSKLF